jgi:predicted secreted protein
MEAEPEHLELVVGQQHTVQLPGLGAAGYVWDHDVLGEGGVVEVEWTRGDPPGSVPRRVGVSAPEAAAIRSVGPGTVVVRLYQHRRWEPPDSVRAERRLLVLVRQPEEPGPNRP